jgi:hypothetical protein
MQAPNANEYNPYFETYVKLVDSSNFDKSLAQNKGAVLNYFSNISEVAANYRYASDKWSVKEVLMHIVDVERTMFNRLFVAARGDHQSSLFKMDDALYQQNSNAESRTLKSILDEFNLVRNNTEFFIGTLNYAHELLIANTTPVPITVRALAYIIIGHATHHLNVLKDRYSI